MSRCVSAGMAASCLAGLAFGQTFGSVMIGPGQTRQISIGPAYRAIRLCNDFTSTGSVIATIRAGWSRTLSPGDCMQDSGNAFSLQNRSGSSALIQYKSNIESKGIR
jgi:hypothetical protein